MPIKIVVPQLGESVAEGTVSKWLKAVGDRVRKEEPLVEIQTDKINVEIPSPAEGTLEKILVQEGTTVLVGTEIGSLSGVGEVAAAARPTAGLDARRSGPFCRRAGSDKLAPPARAWHAGALAGRGRPGQRSCRETSPRRRSRRRRRRSRARACSARSPSVSSASGGAGVGRRVTGSSATKVT